MTVQALSLDFIRVLLDKTDHNGRALTNAQRGQLVAFGAELQAIFAHLARNETEVIIAHRKRARGIFLGMPRDLQKIVHYWALDHDCDVWLNELIVDEIVRIGRLVFSRSELIALAEKADLTLEQFTAAVRVYEGRGGMGQSG